MRNFFKDEQGNVIIAQKPNAPILTWAGASIPLLFITDEFYRELLSLIAFGALFTWAWLELFEGDCMFRRTLGAIVLIVLIATRVSV